MKEWKWFAGEICTVKDCNCGLPAIIPSELDFAGCNKAGEATKGHLKMCKKWGKEAPK
jgi:hypothetical protein